MNPTHPNGDPNMENEIRISKAEARRADFRRAIGHIGAIQISPRRWAHFDAADRSWWRVSPAELYVLGRMLKDPAIGAGVAYSEWCSAGSGVKMPEGWTP